MIIYANDPQFQKALAPLFEEHQLEPLWLDKPHPKMDFAFVSVHHVDEVKQLRTSFQGLLVINIQDEQNIHVYLATQPFYILRNDYIFEDMQVLCSLLEQYLDTHYATIQVKLGSSSLQLAVSSIAYVESFSHYLTLHTSHGQYALRQNMQSLQDQLKGFIRVHKSYLVAISEIAEIQSTQLLLKDHTIIPIGRTYKKELAYLKL